MTRDELIAIVNDTLDLCENEYKWMVDEAENIFYDSDHFSENKLIRFLKRFSTAKVNLVKQSTLQAISTNKDKVYAVLNFASARTPGGGTMHGAWAQEESLCRNSSLLPVIAKCKEYYIPKAPIPYYTDKIIYSKPIYIFKDDWGNKIDEPIECEVITCAAPNYMKVEEVDLKKHEAVISKRFTKVLKSAIDNNKRNIILGAWGCGAFQNPSEINAQVFREVLDSFAKDFDEIIFAIPDKYNYEVFSEYL